ncbi:MULTISPECIES: FecR domain-containing protein [unclassified Sphingomonas]|jgi:transmembrane sensor|nr:MULTISPECIES: FecR domain-containing protein [unclassified Sphingomonas]
MTHQSAREIQDEAARWVARMDGAEWNDTDEAELALWLDADPRRRGALLQAQAAWATLDSLRPANADGESLEARDRRFGAGRRRFLIGGGAAMAASLAGAAFLLGHGTDYGTQIGEIRRVPLADGSTMVINTASLASVDLEAAQRLVRIRQGELWFQVAKDSKRPFLVEAGKIRVQAVGTAFAVRRRQAGADIFVTEGVVEAWTSGAGAPHIRIAAGEHAFVADDAAVVRAPASASSVYRALAWREGKIDLAGVTLADAAAEFNRYNRRQLVIVDPGIARESFDGTLRTDDLEGFAMAVQESLGVPIDLSDPNEIRLGRPRK